MDGEARRCEVDRDERLASESPHRRTSAGHLTAAWAVLAVGVGLVLVAAGQERGGSPRMITSLVLTSAGLAMGVVALLEPWTSGVRHPGWLRRPSLGRQMCQPRLPQAWTIRFSAGMVVLQAGRVLDVDDGSHRSLHGVVALVFFVQLASLLASRRARRRVQGDARQPGAAAG